jgi:hypothetical protein
MYRGVEIYLDTLLITAPVGGERSVSLSGRFTPKEGVPGTHSVGAWVDRKVGLDAVEKKIAHAVAGNRTLVPQ